MNLSTLPHLPLDNLIIILSYLSLNDLGNLSITQARYFHLFNNQNNKAFFRALILQIKPLNIESKMLDELESKCSGDEPLNYQRLYRGLIKVANELKKERDASNAIKSSKHKALPILLLACADNISLLEWIAEEDKQTVLSTAIIAGANRSIKAGIEKKVYLSDVYAISMCVFHANLDLLRYMIDNNENKEALPYQRLLSSAVKTGNISLVKYFLDMQDPNGKPKIFPNQDTLQEAARSGNIKLIEFLTNLTTKEGISLSIFEKQIFQDAAQSGNLALIKSLLIKRNHAVDSELESGARADLEERFKTGSIRALIHALKLGHYELAKFLLTPSPEIRGLELKSELIFYDIAMAVQSGNSDLINFLLTLEIPHLTNVALANNAAASGNIDLFNHFYNKMSDPEKIAHITSTTLLHTARTGNLDLVAHLISLKKSDDTTLLLPIDIQANDPLPNACLSGNLEMLKYFLDLKKEDGKAPLLNPNTPNTVNKAATSINPEILLHLLHLKHNGQPVITSITISQGPAKTTQHIIPSAIAMQQIWHLLQSPLDAASESQVNELLKQAYKASPQYFGEEFRYLLENSHQYPSGETAKTLAMELIHQESLSKLPPWQSAIVNDLLAFMKKYEDSKLSSITNQMK